MTNQQNKTEQCFCKSYYDDDRVLQDCTCGKCGNTNNQQNREELSKILGEKPNIYYSRVICSEDNPMISLKDTMKCVELLRQSAAKEAYAQGFNDAANTAKNTISALIPSISAPCCEQSAQEAREEVLQKISIIFDNWHKENYTGTYNDGNGFRYSYKKEVDDLFQQLNEVEEMPQFKGTLDALDKLTTKIYGRRKL